MSDDRNLCLGMGNVSKMFKKKQTIQFLEKTINSIDYLVRKAQSVSKDKQWEKEEQNENEGVQYLEEEERKEDVWF